jgi:hypothetical protein
MLELHIARLQLDTLGFANQEDRVELVTTAQALFQKAVLKGKLSKVWAKLTGRADHLLDLTTVQNSNAIVARHDKGAQVIPVARIRGSESRTKDFDSHFNPLQNHTQQRWISIAKAWLTGVNLPPVQLVQVDDAYFVRDGHHRISVARAMGQTYIDANVTSWEVYEPKPRTKPSFVCRPVCLTA